MAKGTVNYTPKGPSKRDIDFDVYTERDVTKTQVNWADVAKSITGEIETIRDERQGRKAEIQKSTDEAMAKLDDMGKYDNQTLMNLVIDGSNFAANSMHTQKKLMEKGLIKPHDYTKFTSNVSAGFKTFKAIAGGWDKDFADYTKRTEDGTNSSLEVYLAKQVESFGNINDMQLYVNPQTGNMALASTYVDDEGITRMNEDPNSHISMQRLSALSKQRIDKVIVGEVSKVYSAELGTWITAEYDRSDKSVTSLEDIRNSDDFQKLLEAKANQAIANPTHAGSILADNNLMTPDGEKYRGGSQEEFDQWAKDHPGAEKIEVPPLADKTEGDAFRQWVNETYPDKATEFDLDATGAHDNEFIKKAYAELGEEYAREVLKIEPTVGGVENPIIVMEYDQKTQRKIPKLTKAQEEVAKNFVKSAIEGHLPHKEKVQQGKYKPRGPAKTGVSYAIDKEKKINIGYMENINKLMSGNAQQFKTVSKDIVGSLNKGKKAGDELITDISRTADEFVITFKQGGKTRTEKIPRVDANGDPVDLIDVAQGLFPFVTPANTSYDAALNEYNKPFTKKGDEGYEGDATAKGGRGFTTKKEVSMNKLFTDATMKETYLGQIEAITNQDVEKLGTIYTKALNQALSGVTSDITVSVDEDFWGKDGKITVTINCGNDPDCLDGVVKDYRYDGDNQQASSFIQNLINQQIKKYNIKGADDEAP